MGVGGGAIFAIVALDLADLHHLGEGMKSVARFVEMKRFAELCRINFDD